MTTPEFSRQLQIEAARAQPVEFAFEATLAERAALASRLGLERLDAFAIGGALREVRGGDLTLECKIAAKMMRNCVVTLEDFPAELTETCHILFRRDFQEAEAPALSEAAESDLWEEPLPETRLDIGEIAVQFAALALDPYPKAPGAAFEAPSGTGADAAEKASPFAILEPEKFRK